MNSEKGRINKYGLYISASDCLTICGLLIGGMSPNALLWMQVYQGRRKDGNKGVLFSESPTRSFERVENIEKD